MMEILRLVSVLLMLITVRVEGQFAAYREKFNLDFENVSDGIPVGWEFYGNQNYLISVDSVVKRSGRYSVSIELTEGEPGFRALGFVLPGNYEGERITLTGYIKTENVSDGWAGLWMRIDPSIGFDNMLNRGVTGTTDWALYTVTLEMDPGNTMQTVVGGMLSGTGKIWIDDLQVFIDGKEIIYLDPVPPEPLPAEKDREFDKGSGINRIDLTPELTEDLRILGLVSGFLKYYHPAVAAGKHNWDYELFRILTILLESSSHRDDILYEWIRKLGEFEQEEKSVPDQAKLVADLEWIESEGLSERLTDELLKVKNARRGDDHFYVGMAPNVRNPVFKNEAPYHSMTYPDAGFRLLSLYRYWNIIRYYYPYRHLIEENWDEVLLEFIPVFVNTPDETGYVLEVLRLITRINDTHANIWGGSDVLNSYIGYRTAPVKLSFIQERTVVTGHYETNPERRQEMKNGDVILKVNNIPVDEIISSRTAITPGSNHSARMLNIASNMLRTNDTTIDVKYLRGLDTLACSLSTYPLAEINSGSRSQRNDTSFMKLGPDIGYLYLGTIRNKHLPDIWDEVSNTSGLIIDLRCYPGEFVVFSLGAYLMPGNREFVRFTTGSVTEPGVFTYTPVFGIGRENPDYYKGKVVILVNEITLSQAEYTAMAFRTAPNATIIGSTTAGASGDISTFYLPGGKLTAISGIGFHYPDGSEIHRVGIIPDIEVVPTIEGIRSGRDELIEKAVEIINEFTLSGN